MESINQQIVELLVDHFGRTGGGKRPRIRKFHVEILYMKYINQERVLKSSELDRPKDYVDRMVKYSHGFLEYINEEAGEILLTDLFLATMMKWHKQFNKNEELSSDEEVLKEQGIEISEDDLIFDHNLNYSKFYKVISDESEGLNDPKIWKFDEKSIPIYESIDFGDKDNEIFSSKLIAMKFYVLRKIDEVAFVTSRFVHCPNCNSNYVVAASKIDFLATYKCENMLGDKPCGTTLRKFPARKMIPTYIYEGAFWLKGNEGVELKEYFIESFFELQPGFHTGYVFGRTENKTNSFYFTCLKAYKEKTKGNFELDLNHPIHPIVGVIDSFIKFAREVGFVLDEEKARLPMYIETLKRFNLIFNKELNIDHSLYYGAPGIGKTYALSILHHAFYSNAGFISGPRFSLPGLTGGQKEVFYQDTAKKKNVPGLFSSPAFIFDEINNDTFLADDKAINLFKSVALAPSGTSSTIGGKEFPRIALVAGTANYDMEYLKHYENRVNREFLKNSKVKVDINSQENILTQMAEAKLKIPDNFDYFAPIGKYDATIPQELVVAVMRTRDDEDHYLTKFPKALMERFYFCVLVHPKYDKTYLRQKGIDVLSHLKTRKSAYSQRELLTLLYIGDLEEKVLNKVGPNIKAFDTPEIEAKWSKDVEVFLTSMSIKYHNFFSMFHRIQSVHVYCLLTLTFMEDATELSYRTKRFFERIISLLHTPIEMEDFHSPDFEGYVYLGESKSEMLKWIEQNPEKDIRNYVDFDNRKSVRINLAQLETSRKIKEVEKYKYVIDTTYAGG